MLDTQRAITTPELIEVQLRPAGLVPRMVAWLVDLLLRTILNATVALFVWFGIIVSAWGEKTLVVVGLMAFFLEWFYPVLFEVLMQGRTPGKWMMGLAVVSDNGTPIRWSKSITRNLLRAADFLPILYGFGIISILLHKEFRRLGDIVAGTLVIYRETRPVLPTAAPAPPFAPPEPLDRDTQHALVAFAERAESLTPARCEELAAIVPHLSRGNYGPQGKARLLSLANYLIGRRA